MLKNFIILILLFHPSIAAAASAKGKIEANVVDPLSMPYLEAFELCALEPQLLACQILEEQWKEESEGETVLEYE